MKIIVIALLCSFVSHSQQKYETSTKLLKHQNLQLNLRFAENINIKQWDKNEVKLTAIGEVDGGRGNQYFNFIVKNNKKELIVFSDFKDYFKNKTWRDLKDHNIHTTLKYIIYVPYGVSLKIKSITSDLVVEAFKGNLTADLQAGNINIGRYNGVLNLKTVSGDLDVTIEKAVIEAFSRQGTIYTNTNIEIEKSENKKLFKQGHFKNIIKGNINNGIDKVNLETHLGNIYLRKKE